MSMVLSTWAIKNPIPPIVLFLALTFAGILAYNNMPITNMPAVVVPVVSINVVQPGASPTEMETQIARKIESAIAGIQGVKHIVTTLNTGTSSTVVEFHLETDFDRAMNDTRDAISNIRDQLPRSIEDPIIQRFDIEGGPTIIYSMQAPEMTPEETSWYIDDYLTRELLALNGVGKIERFGGINHEITVTIDQKKLNAYKTSAAEISQILSATNLDLPGGRMTIGGTEYTLRTLASAKTVDNLKLLDLALSSGTTIKLGDIATVTDGGEEIRSLSKMNGKPAITFAIFKTKGSNEVGMADAVQKRLDEISKDNQTVTFVKLFSLADFTKISFDSAVYTFFEGTFLTIIVVFLFLRDGRSTFLAAIAIPLSIIPTFVVMDILGFGLNAVTLLAISLVTGVLVDDAIVEVENIQRHLATGKKPFQAAIDAAEEIGLAVVATTAVICAVFLPVSFMPGIVGQYFKQFGLTVAIAAFFSLVVARLLTPMMAAYMIKPHTYEEIEDHNKKHGFWQSKYHEIVIWTLENRFKTLIIALFTMALSFSMIPLLKSGLMPYEDYSQSILNIEAPKGSTIEQTDLIAQAATEIIKMRPEVEYILTSSGDVAGGQNNATLHIKYIHASQRALSQRDIEGQLIEELSVIPDIKFGFQKNEGGKDISIAILGEDPEALNTVAAAIEADMRGMNELRSVESPSGRVQPEIRITPDFAKAAQLGISTSDINLAINIATIGDIEANLAKFNYGNRQIPIRVRLPKQDHQSLEFLNSIRIPTKSGDSVPLSAIADISYGVGPTEIERYDRERRATIEANLNRAALGEAMAKIEALDSYKNLPAGVRIQNTGDVEIMAEIFSGFAIALSTGLFLVYMIQVLLYKDWLQPITRMAALPLSIGGTFLLLLVTGTELSMPAIIGILMLMGIADKNAILLVDYMLEKIHAGIPKREAIIEACEVRARPIIMTSLAMTAGMLPVAMGWGLDTAFRAPMAIAVIGGLISSTALSLIFVPVLFSIVRDFEDWIMPKFKKLMN